MPDVHDPTSGQVTIVSVSYNSMAVLPMMLQSLPAGTSVIIVDNASTDTTALQDLCRRHSARLILNSKNCGFGAACNQGGRLALTEFVLFLNPDACLESDTLDQLVSAARRYPKASAMNPRIAESDGSPSFHRSSRLMPRSERMPHGWPANDREVSVLTGAALFVRRTDFLAVDGFDPKIFLYHEDDDLSRRLRRDRGPIMFIRDASVVHIGGASSERSPEIAALKAWHMARSRVYGARKHGQPLPFLSALSSAIISLFALDMLISARRRAKNIAYFKGVISTLQDGGAALDASP